MQKPKGKNWKVLNGLMSETESGYRATLAELQATLNKYAKFATEGRLSFQDLSKYKRLQGMIDEMQGSVNELVKKRNQGIGTKLAESFRESFKRTARKIEKEAGQLLGMKIPDAKGVVANNGMLSETLLTNAAKTRAELTRTIMTALNSNKLIEGVTVGGVPAAEFMSSIREMMGMDFNRFLRVVQAEGTRVNAQGVNAVLAEMQRPEIYKKQILVFEAGTPATEAMDKATGQTVQIYGGQRVALGDLYVKRWAHDSPKTPRETHVAADGQYADDDGFFTVGGIRVEGPGLFGDPAEDCNCLCSIEIVPRDLVPKV